MHKGFRHTDETKAKIGAASRARKSAAIANAARSVAAAAKKASKPKKMVLTPEERRAKALLRAKEWVANNPEKVKENKRRWFEKHRERLNAKQREQNKTPERKAFMREYAPKHRENNPGLYLAYSNNRRAAQRGVPGSHTDAEWRALVKYFRGACVYCGAKGRLTRDHVIPLSRTELSPTNDIDNILPACRSCNSQKGDKTDWEYRLWMYRTGDGVCSRSA